MINNILLVWICDSDILYYSHMGGSYNTAAWVYHDKNATLMSDEDYEVIVNSDKFKSFYKDTVTSGVVIKYRLVLKFENVFNL